MSPFLDDDENTDLDYYKIEDNLNTSYSSNTIKSFFEKDDRKFFLIGGIAAIVTFCVISYIMYTSSKPIDLDDLPVIKADITPIKIKPPQNGQVSHQDKIVYDNISGDKRNIIEKMAPPPEEVLSISEIESKDSLSNKEKKDIINAFNELAPEKEYKINYVKVEESKAIKPNGVKIVEENPPIKRLSSMQNSTAVNCLQKKKVRIRDLVTNNQDSHLNDFDDSIFASSKVEERGIMLQVASLPTRSAADLEYKRLLNRNKILKNFGKKIEKVDLGKNKGITYRVKVGPFKNNADAKRAIALLKKNGFSAYISR